MCSSERESSQGMRTSGNPIKKGVGLSEWKGGGRISAELLFESKKAVQPNFRGLLEDVP